MSERDSSEFETSEFYLKTETRVSVQKHKKWILTGLSFLNKSRDRISTNLVPVPTQIQISGSGQWVDCRMWQLQKISHRKLELWIATSNFNLKKSTFQHWRHCQWTKLGAKLSRNFLSNRFSILLQFQKEISYWRNLLWDNDRLVQPYFLFVFEICISYHLAVFALQRTKKPVFDYVSLTFFLTILIWS